MPDQPSTPPFCGSCRDTGYVCETHPDRWWGGLCCNTAALHGLTCEHGACGCGAGMPCPVCCSPIPQDGTHPIAEAFTPDRFRAASRA